MSDVEVVLDGSRTEADRVEVVIPVIGGSLTWRFRPGRVNVVLRDNDDLEVGRDEHDTDDLAETLAD